MKILGISCSPHRGGNTETLLKASLDQAQADGAEVELVSLSGKDIRFCDGCYVCRRTGQCQINDDMQELYNKMAEADGILIGTPVYFWNVSGQAKTLIDRTFAFSPQRNLRNKAAGAVISQGQYGSTGAAATLDSFFIGHRMIIIGHAIGNGNVSADRGSTASAAGLGKAMVKYLTTGKF